MICFITNPGFHVGGIRFSSCVRSSDVIKERMTESREKLYFSSSLWYHMLTAVKSFIVLPALGWMLCIVAATTVVRL